MKVDKKKMFGIVAVVLMLLVAIAPAVNSMQLSSEEMNELENDPELSNTGSFDLEITVDKLEFDKYVMTKRAGDYVCVRIRILYIEIYIDKYWDISLCRKNYH